MEIKPSIFVVSASGDLVRMQPSAPPDEDSLQELIARYPEIIGDSDGSLLLVQREQPVPDSESGGSRWALDHLFVTRNAVPVLVEVKRASNTQIRREVVGQMMDYAANGVAYWPTGAIAEAFADACDKDHQDAAEVVQGFIGDGQVDEFWSQVDANLRGGRIKLVFVADEIPRELARIVEFLNEQMDADVRAIELRYFEGDGGVRTLAPRIIGETQRAQAQKSSSRPRLDPISQDDWIRKYIAPLGEETLAGFKQALEIVQQQGATTSVASTQGSIGVGVTAQDGKELIAVMLQRNGTAAIAFGYVNYHVPEELRRQALLRFEDAVGPLSTKNTNGYPAFLLSALAAPDTAATFADAVAHWLMACRESSNLRSSQAVGAK